MTLSLDGTAVQCTSDQGGKLQIWGTASCTSTLSSSQSWTIQLLVGDETAQTFVADRDSGGLSQALGLTVTLTMTDGWKLEADLSTYQWAKLVVTGNATLAITDQRIV